MQKKTESKTMRYNNNNNNEFTKKNKKITFI